MRLKWKLISVRLEIVLILTHDRCTVCAKHAIGSKIILHAPHETPSDMGPMESHFGPFGDNVSVGTR
jgi:hypothetical protein